MSYKYDLGIRDSNLPQDDDQSKPESNVFKPLTPEFHDSFWAELRASLAPEENRHLPDALISHLPSAPDANSRLLDVGCKTGTSRRIAKRAGYDWTGIDIDPEAEASAIADGHALPFPDNTFEAVITTKTIQFASDPITFVEEIQRVLTPGGRVIGSVAFLEPFHQTYFHPTHLGIYRLLDAADLEVKRVSPGWDSLLALTRMRLFPGLPTPVAIAAALPLLISHRLWFALGRFATDGKRASDLDRRLRQAGEFYFVADSLP